MTSLHHVPPKKLVADTTSLEGREGRKEALKGARN